MFECKSCEYNTKKISNFNRHIKTQKHINICGINNENIFICNICNKEFKRKWNLTRHKETICNNVIKNNKVGINTTDFSYISNDNSRLVGSTTNNKVFISGSIQLLNNNDAIVIGRGTATFLTDEELGFGWGGGWYMTDSTWVRVRNNKYIYGGSGVIRTDGEFQLGGALQDQGGLDRILVGLRLFGPCPRLCLR